MRHPPVTSDAAAVRTPAVSIVIPARNAQATLGETLDSICAQEFRDWEAIVVDDGSTDGTAGVARGHAGRDGRIRCIPGPARGVSAARNLGVAASSGDLIAFLDADDTWLPRKLGMHVARLAADAALGISYDRILFVDRQGRSTGVESTRRVHGLQPRDYIYENPACTASTLVVRRNAWVSAGGFDEELHHAEDLEFLLRMRCTTAWQVEGMAQVLTLYRASPAGASASLDAMQAGWERVMEKVSRYAPQSVTGHLSGGRAVHLRYLARRSLRLGLAPRTGLALFARAVLASPCALMREPRRTFATLAGLLVHAVAGLLRVTQEHHPRR